MSFAQTETATVSGRITDQQGALLVGTEITITNVDTNMSSRQITNRDGLYVISGLKPGHYRMMVSHAGFRTVNLMDVVLNVQDSISQNFKLQVGSVSQSVTVMADETRVDTDSAAVSTVVDREFADNLPMNGRSFQTLIDLTPGVVLVQSTAQDSGQFSTNGQRAVSNYWMLDGVSANIGVSAPGGLTPGTGFAGAIGSYSVLGGTNSLVSVDAMQEFRIQTSTYAPEFGRTPGAQISIVTRSGSNNLHGTAFDYFRNDSLDANDWFADANRLPKPQERQNDFGGTLSGPILKDRMFYFFSYEGLRLRLPQVAETLVPDLAARQNAIPEIQSLLNAYPLPNGPDDLSTGLAQFNSRYSNAGTLDAYSLRLDDRLRSSLTIFGRYDYSPSSLRQRGVLEGTLNTITPSKINTNTATLGATVNISPIAVDDLRFNWSRVNTSSYSYLDNFGGAVPLDPVPFPAGYGFTPQNAKFRMLLYSAAPYFGPREGTDGSQVQKQINIVDSLSMQLGSHSIKAGLDFRRLSPYFGLPLYVTASGFRNVSSAETGQLYFSGTIASHSGPLLFHNLGVFAQDTWRATPRLTLTYGVRWDVDFSPSSNPSLVAVTGFNLNDISQLALAPAGTPPYQTPYNNVAPRVGVAYGLSQRHNHETVIRGGFGVFYDLLSSEVGNSIANTVYPFGALRLDFGGTYPLSPAQAAPPPITRESALNNLVSFDPHLRAPYTLQWNVAIEQGLGTQQSVAVSYIGASGRRMLNTASLNQTGADPNFGPVQFITNLGTSSYDALQVQFQRRMSRGVQALASYTWSHSIDDASASSYINLSNGLVPGNPQSNRGSSDFDVRHALSAGLTYEIPTPEFSRLAKEVLGGWSTQNVVQVRSAPPVDIYSSDLSFSNPIYLAIRPDVTPGIPLYLYGHQYPGGKIINNTPDQGGAGCQGPFCAPPTDPNSGAPLRQGNLGRNSLRAFGATQWDFAIHRDFPLREALHLQFRAELFNVLNHPNFGSPIGDLSSSQFGRSTKMLGQYLGGGNVGGGGLSSLYQVGGPRSIQLALKLKF